MEKMEALSSQGCMGTGQKATGRSCCRGNSIWMQAKKKSIYFQKSTLSGELNTGTGCPEKRWNVAVHSLACQGPWITPEALLSTEGLTR